jgi:hypothetical protein
MRTCAYCPREAAILKVEQDGLESCELATNSSFVLVRVPLRIEGAGEKDEALFHYSIGSFCGRDTPLALEEDEPTILRFRIPLELFRARERFAVEVLAEKATGTLTVLWAKRWEVVWQGKAPSLEPIANSLGEAPEETRGA